MPHHNGHLLQKLSCRLQVTCLKCHEPVGTSSKQAHVCKLTVDQARRGLEEVLTMAAVCHCRGCNAEIIKEQGCNKMTCTKCRRVMCYLCNATQEQQGLTDFYSHFQGASKCWLFDDNQSGQTEAKAVRDRTVAAVDKYLASIDAAVAFQLATRSALLADIRQLVSVPLPLQ